MSSLPERDERADPALRGRGHELALVDDVVGGSSAATRCLLIAGEPGIGKSSLWTYGVRAGHRAHLCVLAAESVQAEAEMPYTGLEELLGALLDEHVEALPDPQREAVEAALLRRHPEASTDLRTVARGVLTLLERALEGDQLLIAIDDVQWMDAETQTCLAYALRRLRGRAPTVLLTTRDPSPLSPSEQRVDDSLVDAVRSRTTVLRPGPLSGASLREMLRDRLGVALSAEDGRRLADETGGNPWWALQLGRPGRGLLDEGAPALAALVADRTAGLDEEVVEAACLVAALGRPPSGVVLAATGDAAESTLDRAVDAGLVSLVSGRLTCSHPLIGTALLTGLPPFRRRRLHRRAAELAGSVEARALHLAHATDDPEPAERAELLAALDAAVHSARQRGAVGAALRFALRAHALVDGTGGPAAAGSLPARQVSIAELHYRASDPDRALALLEQVELDRLDPEVLERAAPLLTRLTHLRRGGPAARAVVEAVAAGPLDGRAPSSGDRREALVSTLRAELQSGAVGDRRAVAALAVERTGREPVGLALHRQALSALVRARLDSGEHPGEALERLRVATGVAEPVMAPHTELMAAITSWSALDMDGARASIAAAWERRLVVGDEPGVVLAADMLACAELLVDSAEAAERTVGRLEEQVDRDALERSYFVRARGLLHLVRGEHDALEAMLDRYDVVTGRTGRSTSLPPGERSEQGSTRSRPATKQRAMLARQRGDLDEAVALLGSFCTLADQLGVRNPILRLDADVVLAETLIALGDHERAERIAADLGVAIGDRGRAFVLGQQCRIRARLAAHRDLRAAVALAGEGVRLHEHGPFPAEHAHSRLALAEVHERRGELEAGAEQRRIAHELFSAIGYTWWADRAAGSAPSAASALEGLSPSERTVVELVARGASNRATAAELHLSVRTVENHLTRAYRKLGVGSRAELRAGLLGRR